MKTLDTSFVKITGYAGFDFAILGVEGFDILFIGPYDLPQSLGMPGDGANPKVVATIKEIMERARNVGVVTGVFADTIEDAARWKAAGIQYIAYSTDVGIYTEACRNVLKNVTDTMNRC